MTRNTFKEALFAGFALFAMLFGGGNSIFPPYIGMMAGQDWFITFFAYFIADICLAILALLALLTSRTIDRFDGLFTHLGPVASLVFMGTLIFCVCSVASPRTCTISYEIAVMPVLGDTIPLWAYSAAYFVTVWIFCIRESKVIDYIGRLLTPVLVLALLAMIVAGVLSPLGPTDTPAKEANLWYTGLMSGYQTLDCLAILLFSFIVARNLTNQGFVTFECKFRAVAISSLVVMSLSFVIYGGMCYVGATSSSLMNAQVGHGELLRYVFLNILGKSGSAVIGTAVGLACLTTGIALTGALATFVAKLTNGKFGYNTAVTALSIGFAVVANVGLENILAIAVPIILILFPASLAMILLSLFDAHIANPNVYRVAVACAIATGLCEVLLGFGFEPARIVTMLPLQEHGFGWLVPALLGAGVGHFVPGVKRAI